MQPLYCHQYKDTSPPSPLPKYPMILHPVGKQYPICNGQFPGDVEVCANTSTLIP